MGIRRFQPWMKSADFTPRHLLVKSADFIISTAISSRFATARFHFNHSVSYAPSEHLHTREAASPTALHRRRDTSTRAQTSAHTLLTHSKHERTRSRTQYETHLSPVARAPSARALGAPNATVADAGGRPMWSSMAVRCAVGGGTHTRTDTHTHTRTHARAQAHIYARTFMVDRWNSNSRRSPARPPACDASCNTV